jgi:organic hydroperoxide reductase OsmC/OhrA
MSEYFYEVDLSWISEKTGLLASHGLPPLEVASPIESPKEKKNKWTPEHLLAASVSTCFMNTFLDIAQNFQLEVHGYQGQCFVKLENIHGKYILSEILLRPIIKLTNESTMIKGCKCVEAAEKVSSVKNALNINVEVHPQFEYLNKGEKIIA